MKHILLILGIATVLLTSPGAVSAQKKKKPVAVQPSGDEDDYYKMHRYEIPEGEVLEGGALEQLPDGKIALGTRRGEIWIIDAMVQGRTRIGELVVDREDMEVV